MDALGPREADLARQTRPVSRRAGRGVLVAALRAARVRGLEVAISERPDAWRLRSSGVPARDGLLSIGGEASRRCGWAISPSAAGTLRFCQCGDEGLCDVPCRHHGDEPAKAESAQSGPRQETADMRQLYSLGPHGDKAVAAHAQGAGARDPSQRAEYKCAVEARDRLAAPLPLFRPRRICPELAAGMLASERPGPSAPGGADFSLCHVPRAAPRAHSCLPPCTARQRYGETSVRRSERSTGSRRFPCRRGLDRAGKCFGHAQTKSACMPVGMEASSRRPASCRRCRARAVRSVSRTVSRTEHFQRD